MVVVLVLNGDLAQVRHDVLHQGVLSGALLAAEIVEPLHVCHDVIDNGQDNTAGNAVAPDYNDSYDVGPSVAGQLGCYRGRAGGLTSTASEPTKDTEQSRESVDTKDGADKLPRWEGVEATSDKDEPVLGERYLEEEDALDAAVVLDDATIGQPQSTAQNPGADGKEGAEND